LPRPFSGLPAANLAPRERVLPRRNEGILERGLSSHSCLVGPDGPRLSDQIAAGSNSGHRDAGEHGKGDSRIHCLGGAPPCEPESALARLQRLPASGRPSLQELLDLPAQFAAEPVSALEIGQIRLARVGSHRGL
jgi:hypothetical protein